MTTARGMCSRIFDFSNMKGIYEHIRSNRQTTFSPIANQPISYDLHDLFCPRFTLKASGIDQMRPIPDTAKPRPSA